MKKTYITAACTGIIIAIVGWQYDFYVSFPSKPTKPQSVIINGKIQDRLAPSPQQIISMEFDVIDAACVKLKQDLDHPREAWRCDSTVWWPPDLHR
jgi:hypothetical protein